MENKPSKYKRSNAYVAIATLLSVVVFLIAFFLSFSSFPISLIISAVLAIGVYASAILIFKPTYKIGGVSIDTVKNGEELEQLISRAYSDMSNIEHEISRIKNTKMKAKAQTVYDEAGKIIEYIEKNTEKAAQARRFFSYYLDMTEKILKKYNDFIETRIENDEITKAIEQTDKALDILKQTYEQQLAKLMQNDIMDIEADVTLLENMFKSEG